MEKISVQKEIGGKLLSLETGELAFQANGAVLVRYGDTVILATATAAEKPRDGIDFFPLMVDFEEKLYAGGKIPGSFFRREGRPPEKSILTSRLIDRSIRPLFPSCYRHDINITATVLSSDRENDADIPALIGASAALMVSDIPFPEPVAAVKLGRKDGKFIVNPTYQELQESEMNLVVAATKDNIMMVEAGAKEVPEDVMLEALGYAHQIVKDIIVSLEELQQKAGKPKRAFPEFYPNAELETEIRKLFTDKVRESLLIKDKSQREEAMLKLQESIAAYAQAEESEHPELTRLLQESPANDVYTVIDKISKEIMRKTVLEEGVRMDGRHLKQIRPISCQVSFLPRTHGSGLFTRGETQVLTSVTLGTISDRQILDTLGIDEFKTYMHHYNFPPYSVGEAKPLRSPGRREIGHGALAEKALLPMIPSEAEFPYTIRLVSEVLSSNGSTSMASTCASSLALMDAGVPIKKAVAGIAMGLITGNDRYAVLTDIMGMEDALGDMDFKVAGTTDGITALQMDIKVKGISLEIMRNALGQAKEARLELLDIMNKEIPAPRSEISPFAPSIITLKVPVEKIREIIGTGGKVIQKIIADTGADIDVEDDGRVFIAAVDRNAGEAARKIIEDIIREVQPGEVYMGRVVRIVDFGAFIEIYPGKEGLLHISQIAKRRIAKVEDVLHLGDEVLVKVRELDPQGKVNLTRSGLLDDDEDGEGGEIPDDRAPRRNYRPRARRH